MQIPGGTIEMHANCPKTPIIKITQSCNIVTSNSSRANARIIYRRLRFPTEYKRG